MTEEAYEQEHKMLVEKLRQALSSRYFLFYKVSEINRELERLDRKYKEEKND